MIAKEVKETTRLILDHGLQSVELDSGLRPDTWLQELLTHHKWSLESIALLLRRQGNGGLPIQLLDGCLHRAISGSNYADLDEMKAALILLIRGGADVYARMTVGARFQILHVVRKPGPFMPCNRGNIYIYS